MSQPVQQRLALGLAVVMTGAGLVMAAAAALERAGTPMDKLLLTITAVGLALGAHLLPSLAQRRAVVWLLWLGCLVATLYGHAHFFAAASQRAGQQRAEQVDEGRTAAALQAQLAAVAARPQTTVATDLASLTGRIAQTEAALARCQRSTPHGCASLNATLTSLRAKAQALEEELTQAHQAAQLRGQLTATAMHTDAQRAGAAADPIDRALASLTGLPPNHVGLGAVALQALLLELLAATLWALALPAGQAAPALQSAASVTRGKQAGRPPSSLRRAAALIERTGQLLRQGVRDGAKFWNRLTLGKSDRSRPVTRHLPASEAPAPQVRDGPPQRASPSGKARERRLRQPLRNASISATSS